MKAIEIFLCGLALFLVISCGDESSGPKPDSGGAPDETTVSDDTGAVDDTPVVDEEVTDNAVGDEEVKDENGGSDVEMVDDEDPVVTDEPSPDTDEELPDEDSGDPDCQPGAYPDTCGVWAQKMIFTATAKVAGFDAATAEIRTLFRLTHRQQGDHIWADSKICHIVIENKTPLNPINILMPQSFADALIMLHKEADIDLEGNYYQAPYWELRSVDQDSIGPDPSQYVLPTEPNDPRVEDWDNDGEPGLRVNVNAGFSSGVTHIVEKSSSELWGTVEGSGDEMVIGGTVYWTDEQKVLKTDNMLFKGGAQNVIDETKTNAWRQVRIPAEWTCAEVVANADSLFPDF